MSAWIATLQVQTITVRMDTTKLTWLIKLILWQMNIGMAATQARVQVATVSGIREVVAGFGYIQIITVKNQVLQKIIIDAVKFKLARHLHLHLHLLLHHHRLHHLHHRLHHLHHLYLVLHQDHRRHLILHSRMKIFTTQLARVWNLIPRMACVRISNTDLWFFGIRVRLRV